MCQARRAGVTLKLTGKEGVRLDSEVGGSDAPGAQATDAAGVGEGPMLGVGGTTLSWLLATSGQNQPSPTAQETTKGPSSPS